MCDIQWMREEECGNGVGAVFVHCSVVGQLCSMTGVDGSIECTTEVSRCGDPCDSSTTQTCGAATREALLTNKLVWPVPSSFAIHKHFGVPDGDSSCGIHTGLDILGNENAHVVAMAAGKIVHVGPLWVSGAPDIGRGDWAVVVQHARGVFSVYSHNSKPIAAPGLCVRAGEPIAMVGSQGHSGGVNHLHVEWLDDPTGVLEFKTWPVPFFNACRYYRDLSFMF
jgi:hypothetical protein